MKLSQLPLNALHAFEASARHLSFTRAGMELRVTQAAVSQQVKGLEESLGVQLFRRLPRGLTLTDEGQALLPSINDAFSRMRAALDRFEAGYLREVVTIGIVGTFAVGWLLPRLCAFKRAHPSIELRLLTNNNRADIAGEGLDYAIRFGDGAWHGTEAVRLLAAPLTPMCGPAIAQNLHQPSDLEGEVLLRSYRSDEWTKWFAEVGLATPKVNGAMFDSSITMAEVAARGGGVALLPSVMFEHDIRTRRLVRPFDTEIALGDYWLTSLRSRLPTTGMNIFKAWLLDELRANPEG